MFQLPTPWKLLQRLFIKRIDYSPSSSIRYVERIAGFFMLFDSKLFKKQGGFNENYYLYCKDVDIFSRIWFCGKKAWDGTVSIYHDARHSSHDQLYYFMHSTRSLIRLFCSSAYFKRIFQIYFRRKDAEIKII